MTSPLPVPIRLSLAFAFQLNCAPESLDWTRRVAVVSPVGSNARYSRVPGVKLITRFVPATSSSS